ncbi:hypothetical protein Franean1_7181 [Parafrankia sp. EAN1pec]|uniref:protein phosphatase 2C domain-containing protein n=1 Tax=Parafrankia sp. (strain EAN1pec) TaxID=298653 RepID=UPI00005445FA|nr:hypothetical protein Franean1_7181 [Frankia sp. EAN1pec]
MSDFPAMDPMDHPYLEPDLYRGAANNIPPMLAYDGGQVGTLTVRAGSVTAERHRPRRNDNESFTVWTDRDGSVCLLAVAGAVGDGENAGRAARMATALAVQASRRRLASTAPASGADLAALVRAVTGDIDAMLHSRASGPDYLTTLLLGFVPTVVAPGGSVPAVVGRVGGLMAWRIRAGTVDPVFSLADPGSPGTGGAPPQVAALPGHGDALEVRTVTLSDGEVLALTTGGLASGVRGERVTGFLGPLWTVPPTPLEFLASLAVRRNDRDDDRTAAVAWLGHHESRPGR